MAMLPISAMRVVGILTWNCVCILYIGLVLCARRQNVRLRPMKLWLLGTRMVDVGGPDVEGGEIQCDNKHGLDSTSQNNVEDDGLEISSAVESYLSSDEYLFSATAVSSSYLSFCSRSSKVVVATLPEDDRYAIHERSNQMSQETAAVEQFPDTVLDYGLQQPEFLPGPLDESDSARSDKTDNDLWAMVVFQRVRAAFTT